MLKLIDFRINTSHTCKNSNGEWYIIKSKVKVEINDVATSKSLWLEGISNILRLRKHDFIVKRRIVR